MYMRIVQAKYKLASLSEIRQIYDEIIIPQLQKTPGCLYVCLMKSELHEDEGISMTLWDSKKNVEVYEKSGLYQKLLGELKPHLHDSSEWKIQLSEDLRVEYQPVPEEPIVKSYTTVAQSDKRLPEYQECQFLYLRILSLKIKPGKMEEFRKIYGNEIIPALRNIKGCRYAYLTESVEDKDEAVSLTIWNSKQDADEYESSGRFDELKEKVRHTFTELYQWKMTLEKDQSGKTVTSNDLDIKTYSTVIGKSFQ